MLKAEKDLFLLYKITQFPGFDLHLLVTAACRSGNISIQKAALMKATVQLILVLTLFHAFGFNCIVNCLKWKFLENAHYKMHKYSLSGIKAKPWNILPLAKNVQNVWYIDLHQRQDQSLLLQKVWAQLRHNTSALWEMCHTEHPCAEFVNIC